MGKIQCIICQKRCRGTVLKIDQQHVHKACFKCKRCNKTLDETCFHFRDLNFYCPEDYRLEYSIKCSGCGKPVEGDVVTVLGKKFHNFCLSCFSCNRSLAVGAKITAQNDHFYCNACIPPQVSLDDEGGMDSADDAIEQVDGTREQHTDSVVKPESAVAVTSKKPQEATPGMHFNAGKLANIFRSRKNNTLQPQSTLRNTSTEEQPMSNGTGELTVNVGENDRTSTDSGIGKKIEHRTPEPDYRVYTLPGGYSQSSTTDPTLTTPSMLHNLSAGTSTLLYGSVRRIFPPGVDYGHQYPISYLRLAEQGLTAVTSTDDLREHTPSSIEPSPTHFQHHRLPPTGIFKERATMFQRMSRRDIIPPTVSSAMVHSRTLPSNRNGLEEDFTSAGYTSRYPPQMFGVNGRPEKDRYNRHRQLSPATLSATRASSSGGRGTMPGCDFINRRAQTYSSYSTPNMNTRRAETMLRSRREPRSVSPESAALYQAEARRLATYPSGRIPDANSEPAIDRYDFPAPPSPIVVMLDRRRERALRLAQRSGASTLDGTLPRSDISGGSNTGTLARDLSNINCSPKLSSRKASEVAQITEKINTLKRTTGNSGMSSAVVHYLEDEKKLREMSPDLDPISASRSPSANQEPPYGTRYSNHRFASPSRTTIKRDVFHYNTLRSDRSGTLGSPSVGLKPGYTAGLVSSARTVSLPRPINGEIQDWSPISHNNGVSLSSTQRKVPSRALTNRTLPIDAGRSLGDSRDGAFSIGTSALSMDGFAESAYADSTGHRTRVNTLIGGLPPHSISGLRPVNRPGLLSQNFDHHSRGRTSDYTNGLNGNRFPRTVSEGARDASRGRQKYNLSIDEIEKQYPTVQSYLKPLASFYHEQEKVYSYDELKVSSNVKLKGVNLQNREAYLSPNEFQRIFNMSHAAFTRLPEWKRNDLKRRRDLL